MIKAERSELLTLSGLGAATAEKLESNGISTLMLLAVASPSEISTMCGISENKARDIIRQARELLKLGFEKAKVYSRRRANVNKIGTGCSSLDKILGGGFSSSSITEVYGRTGSGKTQLAHLLVVRALLSDKDSKAIYIDSESTFRETRIKDMCEANKLDYDDAMDRIYVARSFNSAHQVLLVDELEKMIQNDNTYKLLVIDSLTSHFRAEFSGRGELANRQQLLNKHLHQLLKIADIYNMVIVVTNQVQSDPGLMYGNPEKPIGGNILSHSVTSILYLRPAAKSTWVAKLVDSPDLPADECTYLITKNGIEDEK